jgi:serine/threonine-protein kinase RsbW
MLERVLLSPRRLCPEEVEKDINSTMLNIETPEIFGYPEELVSFVVGNFREKSIYREEDVRICASELIKNAIEHGNNHDHSKHVKISCLWKGSTFYFTVQDEGPGFDVDNPPFVPGSSGIPPEGGMGLDMVRIKSDLLYNYGRLAVGCAISVQTHSRTK